MSPIASEPAFPQRTFSYGGGVGLMFFFLYANVAAALGLLIAASSRTPTLPFWGGALCVSYAAIFACGIAATSVGYLPVSVNQTGISRILFGKPFKPIAWTGLRQVKLFKYKDKTTKKVRYKIFIADVNGRRLFIDDYLVGFGSLLDIISNQAGRTSLELRFHDQIVGSPEISVRRLERL